MSELEKKFKEYMSNRWGIISKQSEIIAYDLAEIADKYWLSKLKRMKKQLLPEKIREAYKLPLEKIELMQKENAELKQQTIGMAKHIDELEHDISEIKYFDRCELRNLIFKYPADEINEKELLDDICKLALPTREKIIEVLKRYSHEDKGKTLNFTINDIFGCVVFIETLADELLGSEVKICSK